MQVETENFISDPSHAVTQMKLHHGEEDKIQSTSFTSVA